MNKAEQLIACLECEIAKRDARISELEDLGAEWVNKALAYSAELAAIKAQEPVKYEFQGRDGKWCQFHDQRHYDNTVNDGSWPIRPLYAAPVSEAKAHGVVMPDELAQAFITGESCNGEYRVVIKSETLKEMQAVHGWLARLNAAPVQQVSVPDGWRLVPVELTPEMIDVAAELDLDPFDNIDDELCAIYAAMLAAAPAAPAADAWIPVSERLPSVEHGKAIEVIVAVKRKHNSQVYVFTTEYLNCVQVNQDGQFVQDDDNDNAAITGWFHLSDDEETWHRALGDGDELLAWQYKPAYAANRAQGVV